MTFGATVNLNGGATVTLNVEGVLNGVEVDGLHSHTTISSTDKLNICFSTYIDVTTASWDLDIRANIDSAVGRLLTVEDAQLNVLQVAGT